MKHLVFTLWFVLFLSSTGLAGVEYVTEEVCHAPAGCWVNVETGECPACVIGRREVTHTHEEKPVIKNQPVVKTTPKKEITIPSNKKWVGTLFKCQVGCRYAYWDSAGNDYDKNMNLVSN